MRAMILAAGLGTRLRPLTYAIPKPMVPVLNRPVMEHIAELLAGHGFTEVIANLHWFPETIRGHFGDGSGQGISLAYSEEDRLHGTAGGVRLCAEFLGESFLVISGDALTGIDLSAMREFHESHDGVATLATKRVADTSEFGVAITDEEGRIQGFQEKPEPAEALSDLANCGIYMFRREIFDYFPAPGTSAAAGDEDPDGFADWAMDVFPALMEAGTPFYSHPIDQYWNDIGTISEFRQGSFDGLSGAVELGIAEPEVAPGVHSGSGLDGVEVGPPALIGSGCRIEPGAELRGPVVIGDGCRIGAGARLRDSILLDGAEIPAGGFAVEAVLGRDRPA